MIFFTLILLVKSCYWRNQYNYRDISLYPTNGEYFQYSMKNLFDIEADNIIYHYNPIKPNVQIANSINEITQIEGYEFISISSNQTHFVTITKENFVILYEWKNLNIQQYGQISMLCYNIILFDDIDVLLDCYKEEQFYMLKLMNTSFNIVYSNQVNKPISTKMKGIYNESKSFLIYAQQYYQNFSILTLFSSQFKNLTSYQNQFIEIGIHQRENPYIYILFRQFITQFIITQNYTFELRQYHELYSDIIADHLQALYNYQTSSQCDQLYVSFYHEQGLLEKYLGCQNSLFINQDNRYVYLKRSQLIQFFFNDEFVIYQSQHYLTLFQQEFEEYSIGQTQINKNAQIYFNPFYNQLFIFHKQIIIYQLVIPQLQINLTDQQVQGQTYDITISAQFFNTTFNSICKMFMSITILDQNDTNIYVMFIQNFHRYTFINGPKTDESVFVGYLSKLLNYTLNTNNTQFGSLKQNTFQICSEFYNQQFYLAQLLNTDHDQEGSYGRIYFIGVTNESIQIFTKDFFQKSFDPLLAFNITINAQCLQVAYNIDGGLIIGLSDNDTIYLYQTSNYPYFSSQFKFKQQFSYFLVTFKNLITLFINTEIQIMNLNFTDLVIINESLIHKLFKQGNLLKFNPIQIAVNTQFLSSCLFINNINNVIIIDIGQNNRLIPISITEFKFKINQINIVNQQLVLSYICSQGLDLCFQVWNIQNFKQPFFVKNLMSVQYNYQLQILSDNLYFYVQFQNYTLFVYNPYLPEHMSLYYQLELSIPLICTICQMKNERYIYSLLYYNNKIYQLSMEHSVEFKINQSLNFERSYPQMFYNYSVTSLLNRSAIQFTPNQSLTYQSNFTIFQPKNSKTIVLLIQDLNLTDRTFTIPMSNSLYFPNDVNFGQYFSNNVCNLTNFGYINKTPNQKNYTLITAINNQFFVLQNNEEISIFNQKIELLSRYDYSSLNFTECLKSTSYNLTLCSICQNHTAQYWVSISFDSLGDVLGKTLSLIPNRFSKVSKINSLANLNFILGSFYTNYQQVYLFNSLNNSLQQLYQDYDYFPSYCQDFSVALYNSSLDINQQNLVIILYIINKQATCQYLFFRKNSIYIPNMRALLWIHNSIWGVQISILQIINDEIFVLITIFRLLQHTWQETLRYFISTIPPYGDLLPILNSIYFNGLLLQQFKQGNTLLIGIYEIRGLLNNSLDEPILMLGSLNTTSLEYAFIGNNKDQVATCLAFNNGSVLQYPINTNRLTCHYKQHSKTVKVNISCYNEFSSGSYQITFILPEVYIPKRGWIYSLIIIISVQLIGFYLLVKYRMRNIGYINTEIEL